jgi:antirestriction protein ArdC
LEINWRGFFWQAPYDDKKAFEEKTGKNVRGFEYQGKNDLILWGFYTDRTYKWITIPRNADMYLHSRKGTQCSNLNSPYLYAYRPIDNFVWFYLLEGGRY